MKAIEFKTRMKDKFIKVPENLNLLLPEERDVRVILLFEEKEKLEDVDFRNLANEQFLAGYSESDSVYDNY